MADRLQYAAVVEFEESVHLPEAVSSLIDTNLPFTRMSSLSPFKIVLLFDNEESLWSAIEESSPIRALCSDVRRWSENETYTDRLTWVECVGIHPKCWGFENFMKIGERWGKTLRVDHIINGINSLTTARMLIRTNIQRRIEECIRLKWQSGSCEVWINEIGRCVHDCSSKSLSNEVIDSEPSKTIMPTGNEGDYTRQVTENLGELQRDACLQGQVDIDFVGEQNLEVEVVNELEPIMEERRVGIHDFNEEDNNSNKLEKEAKNFMSEYKSGSKRNRTPDHNISRFDSFGNDIDLDTYNVMTTGSSLSTPNQTPSKTHVSSCAMADYSMNLVNQGVSDFEPTSVDVSEFDPMVEVEIKAGAGRLFMSQQSFPKRRTRGRPRKGASSLPIPLFVPSTPSKSLMEAQETWKIAKAIGVSSINDGEVVAELRKSKRIMALEENNPVTG
ncbi:unnamed protein product [Amaranthus hypochondriacus]